MAGGYDTAGVWVWGDNSTIDNNLIVSFGELGDGIFLNDIEGINITSNIIATLGEQGDGILSQMSEEASLLFYNNVIGTFGENSSGIHLAQDSYSNLSLNNISTFGNYSYGVFFNESHNNTIASNRITTWQSTSYLIYLTTSGNQTVYDNFLNTSTTGSGVYITDSNLNYFNTTNSSSTNIIGKSSFGGNFWTNANGDGYSDYCVNFGSDYYCDSSYRIVAGIDSYDYLPLTNYLSNLSTCGELDTKKRYVLNTSLSSNGTCFNITINRVFLDLAGNTITGNATGDGINISGYNDTTIKDGLIYNFSNGIFLNNSQDNNITNITLGDNNRSLYIDSSPSNVFSDITLNNSGQNGVYLNGTASSNNNFTDVMVENSIAPYYDIEFGTEGINGTWIIDSLFTSYAFAGEGGIVNFKISGYAMVEFLEPINGSGAYLTLRDVDIDNNLLFVNSSSNSGLNKSAKITFYGISYTDPKPQYSSDNSVWTDCTASTDPSCNEVSYSGTTFVFNVSHFTYFRSAETTTSSTGDDDDSSSSGGGYPTFRPTEEELKNGYTKFLYRNWKISFKLENVSHIFKVENVNATNSKISISSETQEATLSVGEEKKFDLSGDDSYDLQVKLNSIDSSKANFTLQTIHEEKPESEDGEGLGEKIGTIFKEDSSLKWIIIVVIIILVGILLSKGKSLKKSSGKR